MDVNARIASRFVRAEPLPNEYLIMLRASAIRQSWSPAEELRRRGGQCSWTPPDADMDVCRTLVEQHSVRSQPSSRLRRR